MDAGKTVIAYTQSWGDEHGTTKMAIALKMLSPSTVPVTSLLLQD